MLVLLLSFCNVVRVCVTQSVEFGVSCPFSDITTLTSASYQSSIPMHAGQHLLSIQGEVVLLDSVLSSFDVLAVRELMVLSASLRQSSQPQSARCPAGRTEQTAVPGRRDSSECYALLTRC